MLGGGYVVRVCVCFDRGGKNSGSGTQWRPLNLEMDRVGCGQTTHTQTHTSDGTPYQFTFTYLACPWARARSYPFTAAFCIYSKCDHG